MAEGVPKREVGFDPNEILLTNLHTHANKRRGKGLF